ncbi:MAG: ABC transporter ATP-binding protein [Thermodesulfobacteriota bacterium]
MLKLKDIHVYYNYIHALKGISLEMKQGEIVTLIGGNGAGKSTTLKSIMGLVASSEGQIEYLYEGTYRSLQKMPVYDVAKLGIAFVPEGRQVFGKMSVEENLKLGAYLEKNSKKIKSEIENIYGMFPHLVQLRKQLAGTLSGGQQQMLAIGRALMTKPRLLLMDEPSLGLAPLMIAEVVRLTKNINDQGVSILLVEQNAYQALKLANRGYVLENGSIELSGTGDSLLNNELVIKSYLGG